MGPARVAMLLWIAMTFAIVAVPQAAHAQSAEKVRRLGYLGTGTPASGFHEQFLRGMRELGWVPGRNLEVEFRFAEFKYERLPDLASELVRLNVDVIVAQPTAAAVAAKNATRTIPIVMVNAGDPVAIGLVASLARPGGNVTGMAYGVGSETFQKGLELLKETVPNARRVAVLSNPGNPGQGPAVENLRKAAPPLGLRLIFLEARDSGQIDDAFERIAKERVDALFVVAEGTFINHRAQLSALAMKHRIPAMYGIRENAEAGGLMSYGPSVPHTSYRAAAYVDKILKGAKPGELPVEQPTKFEFVVNVGTARALGLAMPQALLLRADRVIE